VSQFPRRVLTLTLVTWDGRSVFVRPGTAVDIKPGSALETAYGGPGNLGPLPAGDSQNADKSGLTN
jgi:hypothetical protein